MCSWSTLLFFLSLPYTKAILRIHVWSWCQGGMMMLRRRNEMSRQQCVCGYYDLCWNLHFMIFFFLFFSFCFWRSFTYDIISIIISPLMRGQDDVAPIGEEKKHNNVVLRNRPRGLNLKVWRFLGRKINFCNDWSVGLDRREERENCWFL